jgi:dihydroorotase
VSEFYPIDPEAAGARKALLVYNARLVDRDLDAPGAVLVQGGKIERVFAGILPGAGYESELARLRAEAEIEAVDARGAVLMPAFVDLHAHFRDPGFTRKEDLVSGSRAACAGGYGTVVLMANTDPVISTEEAASEVVARVREAGLIDAFQAVSLTRGFDGADVSALASLDRALVPVATEDGREVASSAVMLRAMEACATRGVVVSCHCEDPDLALAAKPFRLAALEAASGEGLPAGRLAAPGKAPSATVARNIAEANKLLALAEDAMTERNLLLARAARARVHVAHASTEGAVSAVRRAKEAARVEKEAADGGSFAVTCEVTPHHLALTDETPEIVNPPLRTERDREALIAGILDGTVDAIATDHAPHTPEDKAAGAPGFSGIEIAFATVNTALAKTGRVSLKKISELMAANPASILGLERGLLRAGFDADLVFVDPDALFTVDPDSGEWHSRGKNTPIAGQLLSGIVLATFKRGSLVYARGK